MAVQPKVYWSQTKNDVFVKIDVDDPEGTEITLDDDGMKFSASKRFNGNVVQYEFSIQFYGSTNREENMYELINHQMQFVLKKEIDDDWPRLTVKNDPEFVILDPVKFQHKRITKKSRDKRDVSMGFNKGFTSAKEQIHKEVLEKRDVHEDYPHMYDVLHKEELGYRREDYRKVYLVLYNLCQFVGFMYILTVMSIRYSREGPDSMAETYSSVGGAMRFLQLLQFLEVMHPMFGYTKGNPLIAFVQVGGRAFILFLMIEAESRMQTKPVVFYLFFVWSLVEVFRYPYYITQVLNVESGLLTWFRYTIWIPLYPLGFVCEGIIVLRNIPYFEETGRFTVSLPNAWNFAFHFPTLLRIYLLVLCGPSIYTMMSHMHQTRIKKLGGARGRQLLSGKFD
ncbi:very-long-chain (3R)-3-hydroxyacyl-CoA dehydratase 4 [Fopius arisanus]|uniref:Very-long-chain (3R)-3-hydroxyacyl-CoA dehydratase n=2 Tax=Fopius arisanus TaxID=64838 RepID=A0A0C9R5Y1_9HYME|nr:PREDICTED: very-long-chain (3R)-3-hydroxyacyl-CoA dehydratase 4 [Fopius arisanus]